MCSKEYITLLHYNSILHFSNRNYEEAEVSLQNAMLQAKHYDDETLYETYQALYYLLISFTNPYEVLWTINAIELPKQNKIDVNNDMAFAMIKQSLGIGNYFDTPSAKDKSIALLMESNELHSDFKSINYYNIAVINFLFDKSPKKGQLIIENLIQCFKNIRNYEQDIKTIEDIYIQYKLIKLSECDSKDIKLLLLLAQYLIQSKQVKLALQFLNICNEIVKINIQYSSYQPEVLFVYAIYFFDQKQYDGCKQICQTLIDSEFHPVYDQIKMNALQLIHQCPVKQKDDQPQNVSSQKPTAAYRQPKQKQKEQIETFQKQKAEMEKKFNFQKQFKYYYQFHSDLKELFNLKYIESEYYSMMNNFKS